MVDTKTSDDLLIIKECTEKLRQAGINHWIIAEISPEDSVPQYYSENYIKAFYGTGDRSLVGGEAEIMNHHLGALAASTLNVFSRQITKGLGETQAYPEDIMNLMLFCNDFYSSNTRA